MSQPVQPDTAPLIEASEEKVAITADEYARRRRLMEMDPWYFLLYATPFGGKACPRIDRPLLYVMTRRAALLVATLDNPRFQGEITDQVKADLRKNGIDWRDPAQLPLVQERLRRVNIRMPRGSSKSTMADVADVYEFTADPDMTIGLGTKADKYATDRIRTMGEIVLSPAYGFWFPDRVPDDPKAHVKQDGIYIKGRSVIKPEASIEGRGIQSPWTGRHYRKNRRDDIVGTESGDASTEDARYHMSQMSSLRDPMGWEGDLFIGTINGEEDDHTVLVEDPGVLSIVVPIERHRRKHLYGEDTENPEQLVDTDIENIWIAGDATMPDKIGFGRAGIDRIKTEAKANPHGLISLLQNHYMIAHKGLGGVVFPGSLIKRAQFMWVPDHRLGRRLIWRPKIGKQDTERNPESPHFNVHDWFILDLKKLPPNAFAWAYDQSVSESGEADQWAGAISCIDHEGVHYLLYVVAGKGYDLMLDSVPALDQKAGKPPRNGFDSDATQGMTVSWIQRLEQYRDLARRVERLTSSGVSKEAQIINWLQAPMRAGTCYVNPEQLDWINEARRYKPRRLDGRKKKRPVDNQLDAARMAMSLVTRPPSPDEVEQSESMAMLARRYNEQYEDPSTHMDTRDWTSQLTHWRAA